MTTKRELVKTVLEGKKVERVPVGFWYHFAPNESIDVFKQPELREINVSGHEAFIQDFSPDFIKLMSDGYFIYPNKKIASATSIKDLANIEPLGENHQWITDQVSLVKELRTLFSEDIYSFYNIFAPATYFKFLLRGNDKLLAKFILEDAQSTAKVLSVIASDLAILSKRVIEEAGADGIYFSTQNIQSENISEELFEQTVKKSDLEVLTVAEQVGGVNILHVCGFAGASNQLEEFKDYPSKIVNWATNIEKVSVAEGQQIFKNKVVLGGFGNTTSDLLYRGEKEEIKQATKALVEETNGINLLIGADCTVPREIDLAHLNWVREAAAE
ncbi:MAG: uroporphyrinogen decarboxylase [Lactobacillales bacterium]|jgi:uroporphyrinogen decarboxylase|nr:uroporphyrinogen decarboxylase [Lactobacillales bacterium]